MKKSTISVIFSILFLVYLITPSVIAVIDDTIDVSSFYASNEDEEKGSEKNKTFELLVISDSPSHNFVDGLKTKNNSDYYFKKYSKPHLNLISPPPDLNIL